MTDLSKFHTNDLPIVLNREFYDDLVENFTITKQTLLEITKRLDDLEQQLKASQKAKADATQLITNTGIAINNNDGETTTVDVNN